MPELPAYPFDAAICRLLVGGPLSTAAIADRLAMSDRTVRYRLTRLRLTGFVVRGGDGLHRLADPAVLDLTPGRQLDDLDDGQDGELAASTPTPASNGNAVVWVAVVALVAGCVGAAIWVARHSAPGQPPARVAPPPSSAWPPGMGRSAPGSW
jgi:biotin operon repressor